MSFPSLIIKRFFPVFVAFLVFIFLFAALFVFRNFLTLFFIFFGVQLLLSLFFTWLLIRDNFKNLWPLLIILFLLEMSAIAFFIFIENQSFKIFFILFLALLTWIFLEAIFRFSYRPRIYTPYSLENISWYLSFIIAFWFYSGVFAFRMFFNFSWPLCLFFIFLINFLLIFFIFRLRKISLPEENFAYYFIPNLIILELFFILSYLPASFFVAGFILAIFFFLMANLLKESMLGILPTKIIKKHLLFAGFLLILTIILAKWR